MSCSCSCLYKVSKKTCKIIGIVAITIASLFVLLVVIVPILARKSFASDYIEKSNPTKENTNLWAKFPGDLKTTLTHNFAFFDYDYDGPPEQNKYKIKLNNNITLDENVIYDKFEEDKGTNSIHFYNNRTYSAKQNITTTRFESVNLGMFEALETMAYPPLHKLGINSIFYLTKKYFLESDLFIRELFTYSILKQHTIEDIKNKILYDIPENIQEKILDNKHEPYKTYSLGTNSGFFEWIKILGSAQKIQNAEWLKKIFTLDDTQINSLLLNDNSCLMQNYTEYKDTIKKKYECTDESECSKELLYKQLINSSVISEEISEVKTYKELNVYLQIDIYPFDKTPEMKDYFEKEYKEKYKDKTSYEQVSVTKDQLKKFIEKDGDYYLLYLNNSINILHINKTEDPKKESKYFNGLKYDQVNFLTEYFYNYLPKAFLYHSIDIEKKVEGDDPKSYGLLAKAVSNFLPKIAEETYNKMSHIDLLSYLEKKLLFVYLKSLLDGVELEEICPIIYQKVLDDGKKVYQICSDEKISLKDEESFYKYYQFYFCQNETFDESKCDYGLKEILQSKEGLYITEKEISAIVAKDSPIGLTIQSYKNNMTEHYKCPGQCTNEYLLRIQFSKAKVTRNPPPPIEGKNGLKDWLPQEIDDYYEIINILEKHNVSLDFEEQDAFYIIDSRITKGELYDIDNSKIFKNKIDFEKEYTKGLTNTKTKGEYSSLVKLTNFLMGLYMFNPNKTDNKLLETYDSIDKFLEGYHNDQNYWLNILKSGSYFENYNPGIQNFTKFELGFNFDTGVQENFDFDYIGISTDTSNFNKRRMTQMNNLLTLNLKKTEVDNIDGSEKKLILPLFNFEKLLDERLFSDGFQYDHKLDVIYYFDYISSRPLVFVKESNVYFKDRIECKKYVLDNNDPTSGINEIFDRDSNKILMVQKSNKPFMIDANYADNLKKFGYESPNEIQNYICVDPVSDMVVDSKLNFVYSLYARKYGLLNKNLEIDGIYPLFMYNRNFEVDLNSYDEVYPGAADYYEDNFSFLIIGVIIVIFFATFALVAFNVVHKQEKEDKKDLTKVIGDELGEGTEKLKSDADPDADNDALKLKVENDNENKNENENENENKNEDENENLIK